MKYTKEQAEKLKRKNMNKYTRWVRWYPDIKIENGYYILESKINNVNL